MSDQEPGDDTVEVEVLKHGDVLSVLERLGAQKSPVPTDTFECEGIRESKWVRVVGNQITHTTVLELPEETIVPWDSYSEVCAHMCIKPEEFYSEFGKLLAERRRAAEKAAARVKAAEATEAASLDL